MELPGSADGRPLRVSLDEASTSSTCCASTTLHREMAARITGVPASQIVAVARLFATTRPATLLYALGATQHTYGVQQIRCYAILQLLLGNMGLAGGGIGANRGESNVQARPTVAWNFTCPARAHHAQPTLAAYATSFGKAARKGLVNVLKAWFGAHASASNDHLYHLLPKREPGKDYGLYHTLDAMHRKQVRALFVLGENPAVSNANNALLIDALAALELLVVVDLFETETAAFFKTYEQRASTIGTEVLLLPAATFLEKRAA
ncbi:MAG: molybdopterin-dependent oxidoreductase [Planctomycetota bacterium]